jgi:hypothetical protein
MKYTIEQMAAFHGLTVEQYQKAQSSGALKSAGLKKAQAVRAALLGHGDIAAKLLKAADREVAQ